MLNIGDSFLLAGFAQALKPKMKELGVRYEVKSEQSSFTVTWAAKMELTVANTQPDLVIINLGANEMSNTDPPAHAPAIRRIVKAIGGRPCVWVSPPSWHKDTGILDVIRENSAPCRFFDSDELVKQPIPRQSDKIHPNPEGGALWADTFWKWLQEQRAPQVAVPEGTKPPSPWTLKPSPPEEHQPKAKPKE
ncbi:MAG: SGNH/GDSL hydrolase family protein [Polyangiaceae bacterium]|nr:SGNH/GDSL hydrolase family protein [Polyangiaceae bacterium]